jgi:hypothetical protein
MLSLTPRWVGGIAASVLGCCLLSVTQVQAEPLITLAEAQRPAAPPATRRGPIPGPQIVLVSPQGDGALSRSPFNFVLKFEPHGGSKIDPDSLVVTYLKRPPANLTDRVRAYFKSGTVDMPNAEAPPGVHPIRVEISDGAGRRSTEYFTLNIE